MSKLLDELIHSETLNELPLFVGSSTALRSALQSHAVVSQLRADLISGALVHADIDNFVSRAMRNLSVGVRLEEDMALAALAVALEREASDFANEYIEELSRLRLSEMPNSIAVAELCRKSRTSLIKDHKSTKIIAAIPFHYFDSIPPNYIDERASTKNHGLLIYA